MSDGFKGINVKKTTFKQSKNGADMAIFNLAPEEVGKLIEKLNELAQAERGVKLTFITTDKTGNYGPFKSTYFFADEIEAPGQGYGGGQPQQGQGQYSRGSFKPKAKQGMSEATKTAAARTLRQGPVE